jgi:glucose/arabinose dehydrogenase
VFYEADQFPPEYKGHLFVALKGSWNRSEPTGYISNPRSPARETTLRDCLLIDEVRFALDSPLEGEGFEPSVPHLR